MAILILTNETDRVVTRHYRPEMVDDHSGWYTVEDDAIPEPEDRDGERGVLYYTDDDGFWYEYVAISDEDGEMT